MRAIGFVFPLLCVGCVNVQYGSSVNGASVQVNGGNALGVVLLAGVLATGVMEDLRDPQPTYPTFSDWLWDRPALPLAPDRAVSAQDCTKPVELSGNLRCQ